MRWRSPLARKLRHALRREGLDVGRDRVVRLMGSLGIAGRHAHEARADHDPGQRRPAVRRPGRARVQRPPLPTRLWLADITYVWTRSGFCYAAFIVDVFSRTIVGWRVSASLRADLAVDALKMFHARGRRCRTWSNHSDRGVQYLAIRYTERLEEAGAVGSVTDGPVGTATTTPLAESVSGTSIRRAG